ncbi:50S ribosomal protein L24 [Pholiota molesta]|nr:50S ribosomal protein L24 [Pholiota molesta]
MFPSRAVWEMVSQPFKRSQQGLFQGKMKQYGNNVPFSKHKTRRTWLPNVQQKRLTSDILGETIRLKLTTRALKTIKTKGGLDQYLKATSGELLGHKGMELRIKLQDAERAKRKKPRSKEDRMFSVAIKETPVDTLGQILAPKYPTLNSARFARDMATKALNKEKGVATVEQTMAYMAHVREHIIYLHAPKA